MVEEKDVPETDPEADPEADPSERSSTGHDILGFPVVGIGASAGGLEALEELLDNMPAEPGMAFVVVTHQRPEHTSLLPELLGRETEMSVVEATDGARLQPNHVYVAPPGDHVAILGGALHLMRSEPVESLRLPIDHFFRSLAEDRHEQAICIVLSGTGTDGTVGLKMIKAESGMAMAQQPRTAKYAGMPASAIATGLVDYVLPPASMPRQLAQYVGHPHARQQSAASKPVVSGAPMQKIFVLIRGRTGHDFSGYKTSTIRRRIHRRMNVHQIEDPNQYVRYLRENAQEVDALFKELLISVTSFFRDSEAWEALAAGPLPELLRSRPDDSKLRAWVPGCATGEEAYSLAILLHECLENHGRHIDAQIFGTDLDVSAIETARRGQYPLGIARDLSPQRLQRYLTQREDRFQIGHEIREMVIFAPQNVVRDPPFTKLDLLCCRNLLIYLNSGLQKRLLPILHYALKPGGVLFLGPSETIGGFTDLFEELDKKWKIFRRKEGPAAPAVQIPAALPAAPDGERALADDSADRLFPASERQSGSPSSATLIERLLLTWHCPISIVVNEQGDIFHIYGRTGAYLEPAEGRPRLNVLEMSREGLQPDLAWAIREAARTDHEVVRNAVGVKTNGGMELVDLAVRRIEHPEPIQGLLVVTLRPVPSRSSGPAEHEGPGTEFPSDRMGQLEQELQYVKESHQITREELERANEGLKSTNEELQSTNEELQSANEELETSKEELQSLNEELSTVNAELQSKVDELSHTNDDMQNLLNGIDVATVFLDAHLNIRRFTEQATDLIKLRSSDIDRPIGDLSTNLRYDGLADDCREVLKTLVPQSRDVQRSDGTWFMMRILPYRTTQNAIGGVVVTLVNVDELMKARHSAKLRAYFESLFEAVRIPLIVLDDQLRVVSVNRQFCRTFQVDSKEVENAMVYQIAQGQWDIPELRDLLEEILPRNAVIEDYEVDYDFRPGGRRRFLLNARRVKREIDLPGLILLSMEEAQDPHP